MSSIMFQNNSDCSCNSCSTQQKYFEIAKNFKELTTEVQKAQARRNLGISDEYSLKWGNIKGFIEKQEDLTQYLNNYKSALGKKLDKHISDTNNPHNITKTQVGLSNVTNDAQVKRSEMGVAGGVATLDGDGKVPALQLPADEEDVTAVDGKIKFKDRDTTNGMGYVILRRPDNGILTQGMINQANTIYEIRYDFDLGGEEITIPEGCVLKFEGGSFRNGNINGGLVLNVPNKPIFYNLGLSNIKFINNTTPESFGAIGDGSTDDTESLRYAIYYSSLLGVKLVCIPKIKYRITNSLNYYNNTYYDVKLNVYGEQYRSLSDAHLENRKTFLIDTNVKLFKNSTIQGIIKNCDFTTVEWGDDDSSMFDNCILKAFIFDNNNVDRLNSFMNNTSVRIVSYIKNNRIVSRYFSKVTAECGGLVGLVDSYIINNYITGETNDNINNYCFGWNEYNAATISNNFIDFFKIIYSPQLSNTVQTVLSIGNQYQVFKYFYPSDNMYEDKECTIKLHNCGINSIGDSFNWLDPDSLDYLKKLTPYYIKRPIESTETNESELEII